MDRVSNMMGESSWPAVPARHRQPQQSRSRETVERILAAADEEIGELGLHGASTTTIARRAGLSVGALYRFFRDKDEIAGALASQYLHDVWEPFQHVVAEVVDDAGVFQAVRALVAHAAHEQRQHPGYFRLSEEVGSGTQGSPARQVREELATLFTEALTRGGITGNPGELRESVMLCIELVRH